MIRLTRRKCSQCGLDIRGNYGQWDSLAQARELWAKFHHEATGCDKALTTMEAA